MPRTYTRTDRIKRWLKYNYVKLLRSRAGAGKVARGFAVGFGLEMMLPYTAYLGYLLLLPLVFLFRTSLPSAIIGNLLGKATFLPLLLIPVAAKIGALIPFARPDKMPLAIYIYLKTLIGLAILAAGLGFASYGPVYYLYESNRKHRLNKRKEKKATLHDVRKTGEEERRPFELRKDAREDASPSIQNIR